MRRKVGVDVNFIWDIVLQAAQDDLPSEKIFFKPAENFSPYYEQSFKHINQRHISEPTVEIGELAIVDGESAGTTTMTVAVTVKDGASAVAVDAAKVAAMFEATGDLGDWNGAAKLTPTVTTSGTGASGKMTFVVTPGDGTAAKAFLRIRK